MADFWDARAAEDAFFFVDNRQRYRRPDRERFWQGGEESMALIRGRLGVEVRAGETVVEIGCGVGRITRVLARDAARVVALDVSPRMLEIAAAENPGLDNVEWTLGDGHTLAAAADGSADAVVSIVVLQHIPDPEVTLGYVREIGRVLRPGGWAAVQISDDPSVHRPRAEGGRVRRAVETLLRRRPRGQSHPAWLGSAVDLDRLATAASSGGMTVERVDSAGTQYCLALLRRKD